MTTISPDVYIGSVFAGYRIERFLGAGSYGSVYLAEELNPQLQRKVALKILRQDLGADMGFRERFFRESQLVARLDPHPALVPVYSAGEEDGLLWIASRYIDGIDLRSVLEQRSRLAPERAATVIDHVGKALDAAHRNGIVHRDVKPGNILVSHDLSQAYLADFGLSKKMSANSDNSLTRAGQFVGTVKYASPEQLGGGEITGRSDLYALGCVAFELLTGRAPFEGGIDSLVAAHLQHPTPDVTAFAPQLPSAINEVIRKATAKRPEERYATCAEMSAAVAKALAPSDATVLPSQAFFMPAVAPMPAPLSIPEPPAMTAPPAAPTSPPPAPPASPTAPPTPPPTPTSPAGRPSKKKPVIIGSIVLLLMLLGAAFAVWALREAPFPNEAEQALLDNVPASFRDSCVRDAQAGGEENVVAAITCSPAERDVVDTVAFRQMDTANNMDTLFRDEVDRSPVELEEETNCAESANAANDYVSTSESLTGQVGCYRDGGDSFLFWTVDELRTFGTAQQDGRFDADLYNWWADMLEVDGQDAVAEEEPVDATEQSEPATDPEAQLLSHVPGTIQGSCSTAPADIAGASVAAVLCTPTGMDAGAVIYWLFDSEADMDLEYDAGLADFGITRDTGFDGTCPNESTWSPEDGGAALGRVACGSDDGDPLMMWTDTRLEILSLAVAAEGADASRLVEWWSNDEGGPVQ